MAGSFFRFKRKTTTSWPTSSGDKAITNRRSGGGMAGNANVYAEIADYLETIHTSLIWPALASKDGKKPFQAEAGRRRPAGDDPSPVLSGFGPVPDRTGRGWVAGGLHVHHPRRSIVCGCSRPVDADRDRRRASPRGVALGYHRQQTRSAPAARSGGARHSGEGTCSANVQGDETDSTRSPAKVSVTCES